MFSKIETTFNLKFPSYFEHTYNGTTRPETPFYLILLFSNDMYVVGCLGVCGSISCKVYL